MFIIQHKETKQQIFTSHGKKGSWKTVAHAKCAFTGISSYRWRKQGFDPQGPFNSQTTFEVVEVKTVETKRLNQAEELLGWAADYLEDVHAGESEVADAIRAHFKEYQ